jgi:hypothetical protein
LKAKRRHSLKRKIKNLKVEKNWLMLTCIPRAVFNHVLIPRGISDALAWKLPVAKKVATFEGVEK